MMHLECQILLICQKKIKFHMFILVLKNRMMKIRFRSSSCSSEHHGSKEEKSVKGAKLRIQPN